ncbi:hypothetical protein [Bartonella apis]|uniref:hypothetical protein n=1 Tax=Bartonella apis TaxID=1686310 RepID=UPI00095E2BAE|nr:hypothetical protein [Bartonella apis]MCT6824521.1 hypothetical protein [Bartonella apis]MCT6860589.1 hypothetical protein [Bartonella apis]OLY48043.1 hypothetical protein PEB0122_011640 [Bartonella apis]
MANFGGWLIATLKRWLIYIIGGVVILAILAVGAFYMAAPYLNSFVKDEMVKHGVKADQSEVTVAGNVNLKNVTFPVPEGVSLKIGAISGRPPVGFVPGSFTIYNIDLKRDNIHIEVPEVTLNGITLKDKDTSIESNVLQALMRVDVSSVNAPNIEVSLDNPNGETEKLNVKGFWLSSLKGGNIGSVGIEGMSTNVGLKNSDTNSTNGLRLIGKSNAMRADDIDVGYAYSILAGKIKPDKVGRTVFGPVELGDIAIDVFEGTNRNAHFSLDKFKTNGLKMHPMEAVPENLVRAYLEAKKSGDEKNEKAARNALVVTLVSAITAIDAQVEKADIDLPKIKASLNSFQLLPREWNQPVPESLLVSLDGFSLNTSEMPQKDFEMLKNMGFNTLDLSGKIDFSYNSSRKILSLNDLSFTANGIGSGQMSATIINAGSALFSGDKEAALDAANQIGITKADMRYSDFGFIDKLFTYLAQNLNDSKHDLKQELYEDFYVVMTKSPAMLLKDHEEAQKISSAFGAFAKKPGTLKISLEAKDNQGLTATDLETALQNDLATALNKVNLTVKNEN